MGCGWNEGYIDCRGFVAASTVAFVLTTPMLIFFYGPLFLPHYVTGGALLKAFKEGFPPEALVTLLYLSFNSIWLILGLLYPLRWGYLKVRARLSTS